MCIGEMMSRSTTSISNFKRLMSQHLVLWRTLRPLLSSDTRGAPQHSR